MSETNLQETMLIREELLLKLRKVISESIKEQPVSIELSRPTSTMIDMEQLLAVDFDKEIDFKEDLKV